MKAPEPTEPVSLEAMQAASMAVTQPLTAERMTHINELALEQITLETRIDNGQKLLKQLNEDLRRLSQETLPNAMQEVGINEIGLEDGSKIIIKPFYRAHISKDNAESAMKWLLENGEGGIIKSEFIVNFAKGDEKEAQALKDLLAEHGYTYVAKETVHPQTLMSLTKTRQEGGQPLPPDLFGTYIGKEATIKSPKLKKEA